MSRATVAICLLVIGLSTPSSLASSAEKGTDALTFFVYMDEPRYPIKGTSVVLVSPSGSEVLGETNPEGEYRASKSQIREKRGLALLFCFENSNTACSAVRLDDGKALAFDELTINVPLPKIVDRFRVNPKSR